MLSSVLHPLLLLLSSFSPRRHRVHPRACGFKASTPLCCAQRARSTPREPYTLLCSVMPSTSLIRSSKPFSLSALYVLVLASSSTVFADLPLVAFDRMGRVGLAGSFAGLDVANSSSSLSFDPTAATLLSRAPDGSLTRLGSTDSGGSILSACALADTVYVAGNFSSIGGTSAANIASYSPSSGTFAALGTNGPNGPIHSLFCDGSNNNIWAGGRFSSPASAVAVWGVKSSSWSPPPFGGLSGAGGEVLSITSNSSQNSLIFTGSFLTLEEVRASCRVR